MSDIVDEIGDADKELEAFLKGKAITSSQTKIKVFNESGEQVYGVTKAELLTWRDSPLISW